MGSKSLGGIVVTIPQQRMRTAAFLIKGANRLVLSGRRLRRCSLCGTVHVTHGGFVVFPCGTTVKEIVKLCRGQKQPHKARIELPNFPTPDRRPYFPEFTITSVKEVRK